MGNKNSYSLFYDGTYHHYGNNETNPQKVSTETENVSSSLLKEDLLNNLVDNIKGTLNVVRNVESHGKSHVEKLKEICEIMNKAEEELKRFIQEMRNEIQREEQGEQLQQGHQTDAIKTGKESQKAEMTIQENNDSQGEIESVVSPSTKTIEHEEENTTTYKQNYQEIYDRPQSNRRVAQNLSQNEEDAAEEGQVPGRRLASKTKELKDTDVPELSDENRPTKIAVKFSELYDNEWAELFDLLESFNGVKESVIIKELLLLVQDAYTFCKDEADKQIKNMRFDFIKIMCGKTQTANAEIAGTSHLKEFRKANAACSLPSLQEEFFEKRIKYIYWRPELKSMSSPSRSDIVGKFSDKAIELTWWMNVHVSPVYMCSTTVETFDTSMYRAYTKAGCQPDFFVWPALQLSEDGEVLVKGIVQFK